MQNPRAQVSHSAEELVEAVGGADIYNFYVDEANKHNTAVVRTQHQDIEQPC